MMQKSARKQGRYVHVELYTLNYVRASAFTGSAESYFAPGGSDFTMVLPLPLSFITGLAPLAYFEY